MILKWPFFPCKVRHVSPSQDVWICLAAKYLHIDIFDQTLKKFEFSLSCYFTCPVLVKFSPLFGDHRLYTLSHLKSFTKSAVPPIRLFLMIIMMPLKRCVAKENYLIALLRNDARNIFLMSGSWLSIAKLWPLSFSAPDGAAVILYSHLVMSSFPDQVGSE